MKSRIPCFGGCGRLVLVQRGGFCRKCNRSRKHKALKEQKKRERAEKAK